MMDVAAAVARSADFRAHPLGFYYLQESQCDGASHRVHVWLPGRSDSPENDRHQHSFDIHSIVRLGRIRSEMFRFVEMPDGEEREFVVVYGKAESTLSPTGRLGKLEAMTMFDSSTGDSYFLQAGIIHRVGVVERPCVTFLKTVERGAPILSYGRETREPPFDRRPVTPAEQEQIATALQAADKSAKPSYR
ncbi:hypothetical protein NKH80_16850 [Mesorhizobium sp. M0904]|uniref:hypothetical protein n=1 Tax=Mesorhizobium sp. M0904 TaxID=2957022 RepID=UPI003336C26A